ncbi:MAG: hypothetical protein JXA71_03735 [Chitinispirillaceae bacterium]|nr:hypothetical protein [Chitinispirillaceae bacterium]
MPLAWDPLQNRLWEITKTDLFGNITSAVNGEKWADPSVFLPYQEIVAAYLHGNGDSVSLWVKIEFKPWVRFLDGITDEDRDGFREMYGMVSLASVDAVLFRKAIHWIRTDYTRTVLTNEQVVDWANVLASYWYPKLNTDIVDMTGQSEWPNDATEKKIRRELKNFPPVHPAVVIRGNPYGKKIYNVYVVDLPQAPAPAEPVPALEAGPAVAFPQEKNSAISDGFRKNNARFEQELITFGIYQEWAKKEQPFRTSIGAYVNSLPKEQLGFAGKDGWLFFRGEIDYLNGGDLTAQAKGKNPLPVLREFKSYLDRNNISLLFCVVPNKSDVYYEKLPVDAPADPGVIINPWGRKFLSDLENAGIEVVDLLPDFLAAKKGDAKNREALYQKNDTHWTLRGLLVAARLIAGRIKQYPWYRELENGKVAFSLKDTVCFRLGDIVDRMPESDRRGYPADRMAAQQVLNPDGSLYKASRPDAPIMLIGDSFTGVFELIDCKGAGVGAHIAAECGVPVDVITSWGGGPLVRDKMLRARKNDLPKKRLVVYLMVARDLFNYSQSWLPMESK